jgi:hypothetical protein|tara:strand:+ start:2472 stop:2816 length:345 start_codon:yes stop_codon:yes gene_type:complete
MKADLESLARRESMSVTPEEKALRASELREHIESMNPSAYLLDPLFDPALKGMSVGGRAVYSHEHLFRVLREQKDWGDADDMEILEYIDFNIVGIAHEHVENAIIILITEPYHF